MLCRIKVIPGAADQCDIKMIPIDTWVTPDNGRGSKSLCFKPSDEQIIFFKEFIQIGDIPGNEAWKFLAAQYRYMRHMSSLCLINIVGILFQPAAQRDCRKTPGSKNVHKNLPQQA